jgi:putative hydrolase
MTGPLANGDLAELLARAAEGEQEHRRRVLRRAARAALTWPEEAAAVAGSNDRSLTELRGVGPWIARIIHDWLESPPEVPEPPSVRKGFMSLAAARSTVAGQPDWRSNLLGDLQMHTTWSDGRESLETMAQAAASHGHSYVAVTDHSKGLPIAKGMDEPTLLRQGQAIDAYNADGHIRLLHSLEMNLSPQGEGDMDSEALGRLELVLGAFHSALRETTDQTDRYLAAVRNPTVTVLAHPRGRRFGARRGLDADWDKVFAAAAEAGTAVELDCFPDRQDLQLDLLPTAVEAGAWFSIGTDAHHPRELAHIEFGLAAAIAGGVPRARILNFLPAEDVVAWARGGGSGRGAG